MINWKKHKLSQIMEIIGGGTPKTTVAEYWNGDIPWLSVVDFGGRNRWVHNTEKKITDKGLNESSTKMLKQGQIIISARGTVGEVAQLGRNMAFNQSCYGLDGNPELVINDFLYYLIKFHVSALKQNTHGAVFDTITRQTFDCIEVELPPLPEQDRIAKILGDLDAKIELNQQMNKTLEAMAQALFKEWFVDFRFPGHEKAKFINGLPEGWRSGLVGDAIELGYGKALKEEVRRFGNIPVYGSNGRVGWHDQALVKGPGIVVGRKGNPGIITWAPTDFFPIDTSFYVQIKDLPLSMYYLFFALRELNLSSLEADSAVPGLNRNIAYNTKLLMPSKEAINKFNVVVGPLFDRADLNNKASETLSVTRDSLLLKLMAGEVAA